jgi:hypothetical protein
LACHGDTDSRDPSNSYLILQKGSENGTDAEQEVGMPLIWALFVHYGVLINKFVGHVLSVEDGGGIIRSRPYLNQFLATLFRVYFGLYQNPSIQRGRGGKAN